jgi:hypothetical protein
MFSCLTQESIKIHTTKNLEETPERNERNVMEMEIEENRGAKDREETTKTDAKSSGEVSPDLLIIDTCDASVCKRYLVVSTMPLFIRSGKSLSSKQTGDFLRYGDIVDIAKEVVVEGVKMLLIATQQGWISENDKGKKHVEFLCDTHLVARNKVISMISINVRSGIDLSSDDIGSLKPGQFVEICPPVQSCFHTGTKRARRADGPGWITAVNSKGEKLLEESKVLMRLVVISTMMINIRENAELTSEEKGSLMPGTVIEICQECVLANGTKRVRLADHSGWVTATSNTGIAYLQLICDFQFPLTLYQSVSSIPLGIRKHAETDSEESVKGEIVRCKSLFEVAELRVMTDGAHRLKLSNGAGWVTAKGRNGQVYALKVRG